MIRMLTDLMQEESAQLFHDIHVQMASLKVYYEHHYVVEYNMGDTINALTIFMKCIKVTEQNCLTRKY